MQAKARLADPAAVLAALCWPDIEILYERHYREFDTYFSWADPDQGQLRYREDEFLDADGEVSNVRYRLTLLGPAREGRFESDVLLSRSRFLAPATHSLRFYREYFKPARERFIQKDRRRWRVLFRGTEFYLNLDRVEQPDLGYFIEAKSRTWSRRDAEHKAELARELIACLGAAPADAVAEDYVQIAAERIVHRLREVASTSSCRRQPWRSWTYASSGSTCTRHPPRRSSWWMCRSSSS